MPCVLLAEDNPVNVKVALLQLQRLGCEVDVATDGNEAVAKVAACSYALVLMDCHMPNLDGFEATALIRAAEADAADGRHIPIVAMTADALQGDQERCLAAGMDDYISKPTTLDALQQALARWLGPTGTEHLHPSHQASPTAP